MNTNNPIQSLPRVRLSGRTLGRLSLTALLLAGIGGAVGGCGKPSAANRELRLRVQELEQRNAVLEAQAKANARNRLISTRPVIDGGVDLDRLFTPASLSFGRLTGVSPDRSTLRVYVVPLDAQGDLLKSAGGFTVEAFDLARGPDALLAQWTFTRDQAVSLWVGKGLLYTYVLECPLPSQLPALTRPLDLRVTFRDELTGRTLEARTTARLFEK